MGEKVYDNENKKKGFFGFGKKKDREEIANDQMESFSVNNEEDIPFEELLGLDQEIAQKVEDVNPEESVQEAIIVEEPPMESLVMEEPVLEDPVPEAPSTLSEEPQVEEPPKEEVNGNLVNKYLALGLKGFKSITGEHLSYANIVKPMSPADVDQNPDMNRIDVIVRQSENGYEVISMRPLIAAVVEVTSSEAELIRTDEQLKNRKDLSVSDKLALYKKEAELLSSADQGTRMKMLCNVTEDKAMAEILAKLNDIPTEIMDNLLKATNLIPEMQQYLTEGLKMHEAAMIAELGQSVQHKIHSAISREGNASLEQEKVRNVCAAALENPEITADEVHEILFKEKVYTLTESELKVIVDEMIQQRLQASEPTANKQ